jgi:regulator of cell morphogenesis and NO signaling
VHAVSAPLTKVKIATGLTPGMVKGARYATTRGDSVRDDGPTHDALAAGDISVGDVVAGDYRTAAVFERHGIDFCCGGAVTVSAACAAHGIDPAALARELSAVTSSPARQEADYGAWTLTRLIDHIKAIHHAYVRANVAQTAAYARKIADVHGGQHPELAVIAAAFDQVAVELTAHLEEEEGVVFPAIKRAEAAGRTGAAPEAADAATIARGIEALVREHGQVGAALNHLRDLAMGYGLPPDACATYALTYERLQAFEADLHKHVHLENNILFPRAGDRFTPAA